MWRWYSVFDVLFCIKDWTVNTNWHGKIVEKIIFIAIKSSTTSLRFMIRMHYPKKSCFCFPFLFYDIPGILEPRTKYQDLLSNFHVIVGLADLIICWGLFAGLSTCTSTKSPIPLSSLMPTTSSLTSTYRIPTTKTLSSTVPTYEHSNNDKDILVLENSDCSWGWCKKWRGQITLSKYLVFIRPESDHWLPLSLAHSLTR